MASDLQIWNRAAIAAGETTPIASKQDTTLAAVLLSTFYDDNVRELLAYHPWSWARSQAKLVEVGSRSAPFTGDGATTEYAIPFDNSDVSQIAVTINGVAKLPGVDFAYTAPDAGFFGKVTFAVAPANASAIVITVVTERNGFDFIYAMPADCVKPLALLAEGQRQSFVVDPEERIPFEVMPNNGDTGYLICTNDDSFEVLEYTRWVKQAAMYPSAFVEALVRRNAAPLIEAIPKKPKDAAVAMQACFAWLEEAKRVDNESAGQSEAPLSPGLAAREYGYVSPGFGRGSR